MKKILLFMSLVVLLGTLSACTNNEEEVPEIDFTEIYPENDVYYQLFVRSFADSDNDGVGDFNGITEKLDYLVDLGITAIWLMPIHPSPTYHGYDVTDYYGVNPEYGTMEDFENLLTVSEEKGVKIIIDFVLNHSSSQHPWFIAWQNDDPDYAGYYRKITSNDERLELNRGLWHTMEGGYYAGEFGPSMPDINWSNPNVQDEMLEIALFWLDKGVDGFRYDAVKYLEAYGEVRSSTIPIESTLSKLEYYEFLIEEEYPNVYITGEVWSDFNELSKYVRSMDSALNFTTGDLITQTLNRGFSSDYVSTIIRQQETLKGIDPNAIDAPFLRNHDQDRIASELNGNSAKLHLAAEMLLTLPGNPYIYYGEEIGMFGIKTLGVNGIWDETRRLPLLFGDDYTTTWFNDTDGYNDDVDDIPTQLADPTSLLNTYRNILAVRNNSLALMYGDIIEYEESVALQGYYRVFNYDENNKEVVLVLHNVSDDDYQLYIDDYNVLYYSDGIDQFAGIIDGKSTVIFEIPTSMIGELYGEE